eukprot:PLAT4793.1.p1 GENE.PLAT4793.1~~PLAT4793.1.p1  ORF type:complete len:301 (+),score=59.73 PLAT4793.1:72-974(+)
MAAPAAPEWLPAAVAALKQARAILVTAGAGMGVDSGLPDFRGPEGFWKAYPPMKELGLEFAEVSNPASFVTDPKFGWGFFGHRYQLYSGTTPHEGFSLLHKWSEAALDGSFVFTSNVDGHFQAAGFDSTRVYECHGSIHYLQHLEGEACDAGERVWPAAETLESLVVDESFMAAEPLPACAHCGQMVRPNILMFGDWHFVDDYIDRAWEKYNAWHKRLSEESALVIIEIGAGLAVPTVRRHGEDFLRGRRNTTLIRINPREPEGPEGTISVPAGGLAALKLMDDALSAEGASFGCEAKEM